MSFFNSSKTHDPKGQHLNGWIRHSGETFKNIGDSMKSIVHAENQSRAKHQDLANAIRRSADDTFVKNLHLSTTQRLTEVASILSNVEENAHNTSTTTLNHLVVARCNEMCDIIKRQKDQVKKRNKHKKEVDDLYKKYQKKNLKNTRDQRQIADAQSAYETERSRLYVTEQSLDKSMKDFEMDKLASLQDIMLHMCRSKMEYHVRALEGLSSAYARLLSMTVDQDLDKMVASLQRYNEDDVNTQAPPSPSHLQQQLPSYAGYNNNTTTGGYNTYNNNHNQLSSPSYQEATNRRSPRNRVQF